MIGPRFIVITNKKKNRIGSFGYDQTYRKSSLS